MEITKRNYKKKLKELSLSEYPSLDTYLRNVKIKIEKKEVLSVSEELMTFPKLKKYFEDISLEENRLYVQTLNFDSFSHRPPRDFQKEGIKFLLLRDRSILADDMGLGKSIQSILASLLLPEDYKILFITMRTLKYNIEEEIKPYSDSYKVIEKSWEGGYKFTIVHYEALKKFKTDILKENYNCVIIDEAHKIKNSSTSRSKNVSEIVKNTKKVWLLTGTPMSNRPSDYYNLLKLIKHPISNNWVTYITKYCDGKQIFGHWDIKGATNLDDLFLKTKDSVLRRLKKEVLTDLPNKERQAVYLHLENKKGYDKVIENYKEKKMAELTELEKSFFDEDGMDVANMTKFILWRQYCALQKIEDGSLIDLIENQIEEGNKVVVFTNFTKVIDVVSAKFPENSVFIDGRIKDAHERLRIVKSFNEDPNLKLLICNLQVGSVGLNIQGANVGIINDMDWVPSTMAQAEDRLWRMGQLRNVSILYPVYKGTVEEIVYKVINSKMRNISTAIEGKEEDYFGDNEKEKRNEKMSILEEIFAQM